MARSKLNALVRSLTLAASVGAPCLAAPRTCCRPRPRPRPRRSRSAAAGTCAATSARASTPRPKYSEAYDYTGYSDANRSFGNEIGGGGFAGVGVGYQFTPFLRGDMTGEYRYSTGLRGSEYYKGPDFDNGLGSYGVNKSSGHFDSAVVLANAYFDLGTWYGITPFIGGGVGYAFNHVSGVLDEPAVHQPVLRLRLRQPALRLRVRTALLQLRARLRRQRQRGLQHQQRHQVLQGQDQRQLRLGTPCRSRLQRHRRVQDRAGLPLPEPRQGRDRHRLRAVLHRQPCRR